MNDPKHIMYLQMTMGLVASVRKISDRPEDITHDEMSEPFLPPSIALRSCTTRDQLNRITWVPRRYKEEKHKDDCKGYIPI